jgi:ElaB/YqjD/DUF883 family membrane-anchored ribosome-binding protein
MENNTTTTTNTETPLNAAPSGASAGAGTSVGAGASTTPTGIKAKATQGARNIIEETQTQAKERIDAGRKDAAQTLASLANSLLSSSGHLKEEQQELAGEYVGKAAEQIDRLAQYIQTADPAEVVDGVKEFARKRPALFIGSAFAVGIIAARFLKSSQRNVQSVSASGMMDREVPTSLSVESGGAR